MRSDKRPPTVTMADVAERAGVSRALVSIVFRDVPGASPATRERVMLAAEELGYRPDPRARLLGSNRSRTVGVTFGLHHEFHAEVVEGLYGAVEGSGYDLALGRGRTHPGRAPGRAVAAGLSAARRWCSLGPTLPRASSRSWPSGCRSWSWPGRCVREPSTWSAATTSPAPGSPSSTSPASATNASRTCTASVPPAPPNAAAATATPCVPPGWRPRSVWCQGDY